MKTNQQLALPVPRIVSTKVRVLGRTEYRFVALAPVSLTQDVVVGVSGSLVEAVGFLLEGGDRGR